jgi:serine protease AprX
MASDVIWCHSTPVVVADGTFEEHVEPRTLVRFAGPIREEWKAALASRGIRIEFWAPPFGACLTLPAGMAPAALRGFPFLAGAVAYTQALCRRDVRPQSDRERVATGMPDGLVDVVCFGRAATPRVEEQLRRLNIPILSSSSSKIRVQFTGDLATLRNLEGVKIADAARAPIPLGAEAGPAQRSSPAPAVVPNFDGRGEVIAIADTGLDGGVNDAALHRDFQGRIELLANWPTNSSWTPFLAATGIADDAADRNSGHGTHVAGLALGDGAISAGRHRGAAPGARLVFQALEQFCSVKPAFANQIRSGFYLSGRPLDLRELFRQARERGARIHVNSWGDPAHGAYTDDCFEADLFLRENPDAIILFAAGNDGADTDGDGRFDRGSLYAPATAKNVLTIGATEGAEAVGLRRTWGELDPNGQRFRNAFDRQALVSGTPDRIACFSSAGPTADGRIKPDLCVAGTNLAAPRSRLCSTRGWGFADPMPHYMYDGGTSMATLKALLILGARPVRGRGTFARALPHEAGYGLLDVAASLPNQSNAAVTVVDETNGLKTGEERRYAVQVPSGATMKAVLCWYDEPGERLINDLDLALFTEDGAEVVRLADHTNTVEVIEAPRLAAGRYLLRVSAFNVPAGPQPFALTVSVKFGDPA